MSTEVLAIGWLSQLHCLYASAVLGVCLSGIRVLALQVLGWVLHAFFLKLTHGLRVRGLCIAVADEGSCVLFGVVPGGREEKRPCEEQE